MPVFGQDGVPHRQRDRAVSAWERSEPLVTATGGVGQPNVKGDQLGPVSETSILDPRGKRHMPLVRLKRIGPEVEDVLGMLDVIEIPVTLPEIGQVGSPAISRAEGPMAELGLGAVGVEKAFQCVLAPLPSLVKRELLGMAAVADSLQLGRDLIQGLVPTDTLPFALATGPDPLQRVQQSLGMVEMVQGGLATGTQVATAVRVVGVPLDLDQPTLLHVTDDPADRAAQLAHPRDLLDILVLVPVRPVPLCLRTGQLAHTGHRSERPQLVGRALDPVPLLQVDPLGQWRRAGLFRRRPSTVWL